MSDFVTQEEFTGIYTWIIAMRQEPCMSELLQYYQQYLEELRSRLHGDAPVETLKTRTFDQAEAWLIDAGFKPIDHNRFGTENFFSHDISRLGVIKKQFGSYEATHWNTSVIPALLRDIII